MKPKTLSILEDFAFSFFSFCHFSFCSFFLLFLGAENGKNRGEVLIVKMTVFLLRNFFGPRWTGRVRNGPSEGDSCFHVFHFPFHFSFFVVSWKNVSCFFFFNSLKYASLLALVSEF